MNIKRCARFAEAKRDNSFPVDLSGVLEYIHRNYKKAVTLEELSKIAHYSRFHFSRIFKDYTGYTPMEYVLNLRMNQAKKLLLDYKFNLEIIAESIGYKDVYYFSRMFKKKEGISPLKYRKNTIATISKR